MVSSGGEDRRTPVSLETGENRQSVPPNLTTLCELCKDMNYRDVGFGTSYDGFSVFETRYIMQILKESKTCLFCGEIAEFYNKWSREKFRGKVPNLDGRATRAFFQLHKETGLSISPSIAPAFDHTMEPNVNRIRVQFEVPNRRPDSGTICPVLQFQKCSQPPLQVSNGGYLCDWESAEEQPYSGRIRPLVADTQLFRKWKDTCGDTHGDRCNLIFTGKRLTRLRFIDVKNRCVVDNEDDSSYTALSYVWGKAKLPQLTKSTDKQFREPGSLSTEMLPSTIDDAIEVTQSLGEKYIWVDCLCIMQDSEADKLEFIPQMDSIFGFASVTIVAASGGNADAGLPGIKPKSRTCEQKPFTINQKFHHVSLVRTLDQEGSSDGIKVPYHYLDDSVWCERGWTFQEKIFSRRSLIFTKEQVYWECQTATWCEDSFWETKKSRTIYRPCLKTDFRRPWPSDMTSFDTIYQKLILEYSRRTLTYGSDGLDAFEGVLNALRREARQDFLWALPISLLGKWLTWSCDKQSIKRREEMCPVRSSDRTTDSCPFPSWSWVGWVGVFGSFVMFSSSDLIFYYLDGKRQLQRVDEADDGQINSPWEKGCIVQALSGGTGRTDVTLKEIRPASVLSNSIASNILFFWSSTAKLQVRLGDRTRDGHGNPILSHNDKDVECQWHQTPVLVPDHKETADFVTIGGDYQNTLAVLLVDWKNGVAYRRGLVTIYGSHWEELDNREWKMICLG